MGAPYIQPSSPDFDPLRGTIVDPTAATAAAALTTNQGNIPAIGAAVAAHPVARDYADRALAAYGVTRMAMGPSHDLMTLLRQPQFKYEPGADQRAPIGDPYSWRDQSQFEAFTALAHGFNQSFIGGLRSLNSLNQASQWENDPGYDVWADRRIVEAGLENRPDIWGGSRSSSMTAWLLSRFQQHERDARNWEAMGGPKELFALAGNLLGDPTMLIPSTLGVQGAKIAARASRVGLGAAERSALAMKSPVWGTIADGMRVFAINAAVTVATNALEQGFDPIDRIDQVANDVLVPSAIAGSLGLLIGAAGRFSAKNNMLVQQAREADFFRGTVPAGRRGFAHDLTGARFVDDAFIGPTIPAEREAAEQLFRMPLYEDDVQRAKRVEAVASAIPHPPNTSGGLFPPGALATNYGDLVRHEFASNPANAHLAPYEPGSVGAAKAPASQLYREDVLRAQGRMAPTGIGIEHLPTDPVARAALGKSWRAMQVMHDLVSTGGRQTLAHLAGLANLPPIATVIDVQWTKPMVDAVRHTVDQYHAYRRALGNVGGAVDPDDLTTLSARTDNQRFARQTGLYAKDLLTRGEKPLSLSQFRARVGEALNNSDVDELTDGATKYVNAATAHDRGLYNKMRDMAVERGVFDEAHAKALEKAHSQVVAIKKEADALKVRAHKEKWTPTQMREAEEALMVRMEDAEHRYRLSKERLDKLREHGPQVGGARSFRPRMWNADELINDEQEAVSIFTSWLQTMEGGRHDLPEAARIAKQMHMLLSKQNPIYERGDVAQLFQSVSSPDSAQARTFLIPDKLVKKYLVNDSETLMRYHVKQMGAAIEMKGRFGNLDLAEQIAEVEQEYRGLIIEANKGSPVATAEAKRLTAEMKQSIYDLQAVRDKIYGTYGAAEDPTRLSSRMIRMAKQYSNLTLLGMSGITAMGDLVRPLMTEGMDAIYRYGFQSLMSGSRSTILHMTKQELELMGEGMELYKNLNALHLADTGEFLGARGTLERGLNSANQLMFVANGMNAVTDMAKNWAGLNIMGRVNRLLLNALEDLPTTMTGKLSPRFAALSEDEIAAAIGKSEAEIERLSALPQRPHRVKEIDQLRRDIIEHQEEITARGGGSFAGKPGEPLTGIDRGRFAAAGIGDNEARKIGLMLKIYGQEFLKGGQLVLPDTARWTDQEAALVYRSAINQMINRTVPTPGIGDRPNWLSTEWGSLIGQYKSFSIAAQIRTLQSGLQEGGSKFWYGAAGMVGFTVLLNEIRSRLFYDKSTFDRPVTAVLADAVDRSSVLGYFSDANRAVEALTGNRLGVRPLIGAAQPRPINWAQAAGAVAGPSAGQAVRAADVATDFISGHPTARTYANWRTLMPGQNLPYLDPVADRLISTGSYRQMAAPARELNKMFGVEPPPRRSKKREAVQ